MSTVVPKRRIYDGDTVNPEDFNETVDDVNRELANLNEHNLSAAGFRTQVALSDLDNSVAWRIKHAYNTAASSTTIANSVAGGDSENAAGVLLVSDVEQWVTIYEFSWSSAEFAHIYAMANVQANTMTAGPGGFSTSSSGLPAFQYKDAANIKLSWVLDGVNPSEHVRGSLDTGACAINMERGFSGRFNAQDVSAVFHDIAPGDHTIRLCVMRAEMPDEVDEFRKRINVPIWSALIWEIRR
tara:strand:- start:1734 stop:2456 length:723 start_codon:yes stop_codon:yes gene_type:complete